MAWFSTSLGVLNALRQPAHSHTKGVLGLILIGGGGEGLAETTEVTVGAGLTEAPTEGGGLGLALLPLVRGWVPLARPWWPWMVWFGWITEELAAGTSWPLD